MAVYNYNNLTGCVQQHKNRQSGTLIGVYHGRQSGISTNEKWICLCEEHGQLVGFETLRAAKKFSSVPGNWCSDCKLMKEKNTN